MQTFTRYAWAKRSGAEEVQEYQHYRAPREVLTASIGKGDFCFPVVGSVVRDIVRVLLPTNSPQSFSLTRQLLERSGCDCRFAGSAEAAEDLLELWQFDIILRTHRAASYTIRRLVDSLSGSGASLFISLRVEEGSWWSPILQYGEECY